jgi:hypothetical protein
VTGEPHATLCQTVNMWCLNFLLTVWTRISVTEVVGKYDNYIGLYRYIAIASNDGQRNSGNQKRKNEICLH